MNKFNLHFIAATALAATALTAAPANAVGLVLPPNANGTDNSGITALLCDSSLHMRLPITQKTEPDFYLEKRYYNMTWEVSISGTSVLTVETRDNNWADDVVDSGVFDPSLVPGDSATLLLEASDSDQNVSNSFELVVEKIEDTFGGGNGTRSNPYRISTVEELSAMRCHSNKYFKLVNDIDLEGVDWLPIGAENVGWSDNAVINNWRGALDGNGHIISNLEVEGIHRYSGLFGWLSHYVVRDLTLKNFDIEGVKHVGALAGRATEGSMFNIKVINSKVGGITDVGLLAGHTEYESNFDQISTRGEVIALPRVQSHWIPGELAYSELRRFAGVTGAEYGDGTVWKNVSSNVEISVADVTNRLEGQNFEENPTISIQYVGGIAGEATQGFSMSRIKADTKIVLGNDPVHPSESWRVGGLFGAATDGFIKHAVVNSEILDDGFGDLDRTGGVIGAAEGTHFANIQSRTNLDFEAGFEDSDVSYENDVRDVGGVFGQDGYDNSIQYFQSNSTVKIVRMGGKLSRVGGFMGYEDDSQIYDVNSFATLEISDADGSNNSEGVILANPNQGRENFGGFSGFRSDFLSHTSVSSVADVTISGAPVTNVGGYFGLMDDSDGFSHRNAVVRGSITVPAGSSEIGGFIGKSAAIRLGNVIVSTKLNLNGSTENVGPLVGEYIKNGEVLSRFYNTFLNSDLNNPGVALVPGKSGAKLKSAKFLRANGFDLVNVFLHKEGKFPIIRMQLPTLNGDILRKGRTNQDTSISVSVMKKNGSRSFFVNMPNINARQTASLYVVRNGKKVKEIHTAALNMVGNWYTTSKFKVRIGDVLQVEIGGKKLRTLIVN